MHWIHRSDLSSFGIFHYVFDCGELELRTFNIPRGFLCGHIQDGRHFKYTNDTHVCTMHMNDLCVNLFIVITTKKPLRYTSKLSLVSIFQYGCQYFQHWNALFTTPLEPLGRF